MGNLKSIPLAGGLAPGIFCCLLRPSQSTRRTYPLGEHVTALFWECAPPLAQSRTQWLRRVGEQALQGCGTGAGR